MWEKIKKGEEKQFPAKERGSLICVKLETVFQKTKPRITIIGNGRLLEACNSQLL